MAEVVRRACRDAQDYKVQNWNPGKEKCLGLKFADGSVDQVETMKRRDEAFSTIIGFSGLQWQQLQPKSRKNIQR